jgi:hypothetical protein
MSEKDFLHHSINNTKQTKDFIENNVNLIKKKLISLKILLMY